MASTESPVEPQISIPGCQILSHLDSPTFNNTGYPQVSRFASTRTTSDKTTSFPRGRHPSRRRPSLIADDVLPIGILENASVAGQLLNDTSDSRISNRRSLSCATATSNSMAVEKVQRWSGMTRTVSDWDGLRRDSELWVQDGDCYVHLYAQGASRRGPSFCVPFRALRQKKCNSMLNVCHAQIASRDGSEAQPLMSLSSSLILPSRELGVVNLYIPVPEGIARQDSFKWHVTTRNFFAFLLGKPLVGYHMGQTFVDLQERLHLFRSGLIDNHQDFLQYAEDQGYHDFAECTDYALACLFYAETYKLRQAWIDAFAHCVGMNESLSLSPEYANISRLTKALITRAFLEVDIHLGQVTVALSKFLEDDLSPTYLGLTPGARSHLNRFRRFLHGFYVKKFGYWPPPRGSAFPKALYKSMYFDFQNLYDYLVDTNSTTDFALQGPASGGICVLQNVDSFDKRHKFTSQPHPLPLVPSYTEPTKKMESQKALRQLTLANQHNKANGAQSISSSLTAATNLQDPAVVNSNIVQEYAHFERTYSSTFNQKDEKVSVVDARKVRWLLIYGTLQYLVSALRAPKEVRDSETPDYPLCCLLPEQSSWPGSSQVSTPSASSPVSASASTVNVPQAIDEYLSSSQSDFTSIQPDCHREDYFSSRTSSQRGSVEVPAPLRLSTPVSYPPTRTFGSISLSGRSSRRSSVKLKPNHHCEIIVHGYGNGLNEATTGSPTQGLSRSASVNDSNRSSTSILPEGAGPETSWIRPKSPPIPPERTSSKTRRHTRTRTPLFTADQLKNFFPSPVSDTDMSRSDSTSSHGSQVWSETSAISSKSSADGDYKERHSTTVEDSGLLGGFVSVDSTPVPTPRTRSLSKSKAPASQSSPPPTTHMQAFRFDDDAPQTPNYDHIHPAFRPPTADTTIGLALSPQVSPPLSPSINLQSSYFDPVLAAPKNTPSHSLSRSSELTYADLPISKIPSRRASHREHGLFTTISSSSKEAEKRASSERTKNRMSILKKFYAF